MSIDRYARAMNDDIAFLKSVKVDESLTLTQEILDHFTKTYEQKGQLTTGSTVSVIIRAVAELESRVVALENRS